MAINSGNTYTTAVVPINTKVTPAIDLQGGFCGGVILPAALTSTALTFTVSNIEGGTYVALTDTAGNAISYTVAASKAIAFPKDVFAPWKFVILNFGTNETAERTIIVMIRAN